MTEGLTYEESMKDVVEWARKTVQPDDFWVDVGANFGYITFCLLMRNKVRGSMMIEPFPVGPLANMMLPIAALDETKVVTMYEVKDFPEMNSVIDRRGGTPSQVPATTLDEILKDVEGPIVLKMDCEFIEPLIWKGMQKILPKVRAMCIEYFPDILENDAKLDPRQFMAEIVAAGFKPEGTGYNIFFSR